MVRLATTQVTPTMAIVHRRANLSHSSHPLRGAGGRSSCSAASRLSDSADTAWVKIAEARLGWSLAGGRERFCGLAAGADDDGARGDVAEALAERVEPGQAEAGGGDIQGAKDVAKQDLPGAGVRAVGADHLQGKERLAQGSPGEGFRRRHVAEIDEQR